MLIYFDPAALCDLNTNLILAPLPGKKQLWEARDEFTWLAESTNELEARADFGLAANGELVKLSGDQSYCGDAVLHRESSSGMPRTTSSANWEEWCSGMDGFGGLVLLAASLIA